MKPRIFTDHQLLFDSIFGHSTYGHCPLTSNFSYSHLTQELLLSRLSVLLRTWEKHHSQGVQNCTWNSARQLFFTRSHILSLLFLTRICKIFLSPMSNKWSLPPSSRHLTRQHIQENKRKNELKYIRIYMINQNLTRLINQRYTTKQPYRYNFLFTLAESVYLAEDCLPLTLKRLQIRLKT